MVGKSSQQQFSGIQLSVLMMFGISNYAIEKLLRNEDIDAFWSDKESSRAENGAAHNFRLYIYDKVATQEKVRSTRLLYIAMH